MLTPWDDLAIHQTPATLDQTASSDPAAYERFYFGFYDVDGSAAVGLTVNVHPNKGLVDAAFTTSSGSRHESLMASDHLGHDRQDIVCGPIRLTLEEPMKRLRIRVADAGGFDADITFTAVSPAIEEDRVTRLRSNRVVQDRSRYVQLGSMSGRVSGPLGTFAMTEDTWKGARDHSWGIWDAPKQHTSETKPPGPSFFWLIGTFADWSLVAVTHEDNDGKVYGEYAAVCPSLDAGADPTGPGSLQQSRPMKGLQTTFPADSWHFSDAILTIGGADGKDEPLALQSVRTMLPRAIGYSHPTWISGSVPEALPALERHGWDLETEDLLARHNHRGLQFVRMTRADGATGFGVVDQMVSASHATAKNAHSSSQLTNTSHAE